MMEIQKDITKGMDSAEHDGSNAKMKIQLFDLLKRKRVLMAQIGAVLYEATKDDAAFRAKCESLYEGIDSLDRRCRELKMQIKASDEREDARRAAIPPILCPDCLSPIYENDEQCGECGLDACEARVQVMRKLHDGLQEKHGKHANEQQGTRLHAEHEAAVSKLTSKRSEAFQPASGEQAPSYDRTPYIPQTAAPPSYPRPQPMGFAEPANGGASLFSLVAEDEYPVFDGLSERMCPQCGHRLNPTDRFCMQCGLKV